MKTDKKNFTNPISSPYYLKILNKYQNQRKNLESLKSFKVSSTNITYNKYKSEIPYSIKPLFCSVPKDVNMHKILVNMMNSSFKINGNKSIYVKMSQKDLKTRNNILNNIRTLLNKKGISKKIFCAIIFLYDILYIKNIEKNILSNQDHIGIGALLLSLKFIYGKVKFAIKNLSLIFPTLSQDEEQNKKDISEIEIKCLKLIDYYLNYASPISFMEIFFINGIIFSTDNIKTTQSGKIYELVIELIEKVMLISNEYIKYNPLCLCSCIVSFARERHNLEKWPKILTQAFGVNFSSFDDIYNEFHEFVTNTYKNDENKLSINNIYKHKSLVKLENEKSFKYMNNKYNSIDGNNCQEYSKNKKSPYQIKNFLSDYKNEKPNKEYNNNMEINNNNNNFEDNDTEIPSLTEKKGFVFKSIFANKLNEKDKVKRQILFKSNNEEDYSNLATSENSNNYNKNIYQEKSNNNSNISPNEKDEKHNSLYKTSYPSFNSQKQCNKKYDRWNSIKKLSKIKNVVAQKESFYPCTEIKQNFSRKNYNNNYK